MKKNIKKSQIRRLQKRASERAEKAKQHVPDSLKKDEDHKESEKAKSQNIFKNMFHLSEHRLLQGIISSTESKKKKKDRRCLYCDLPVTSSEFLQNTHKLKLHANGQVMH